MQVCVAQGARAVAVTLASAIALHVLGYGPLAGAATPVITLATVLGIIAVSTALDTRPQAGDAAALRAGFVGELAALLSVGSAFMTVVAVAGALVRPLTSSSRSEAARRIVVRAMAALIAAQAGGAVYDVIGSLGTPLVWPWQAVPLAGAAISYAVAVATVYDLVGPLVTRTPRIHRWPTESIRHLPQHLIAAAVAGGLIEITRTQAWSIAPVAVLPLVLLWYEWSTIAVHTSDEDRLHAVSARDHGLCALDRTGRITSWNALLHEWLECPEERAVGRWLQTAVPALGATGVPRAVQDCIMLREARVVSDVQVRNRAQARTCVVALTPSNDGVVLVWADVSDRVAREQAHAVSADQLLAVLDGAGEGLWTLDATSGRLTASVRWRELVGLPTDDGPLTLEAWLSRVHDDDRASFRNALDATIVGRVALDHEQRVRQVDGSWRRVRVHGAARCGDARRVTVGGSLATIAEEGQVPSRPAIGDTRDTLTGLLDRPAFAARLHRRLLETSRSGRLAVIVLDLDRFKVVNDSLGHALGDVLLGEVGQRVLAALRPADLLARLGSDEFAVLLDAIDDETQANVVGFRLQEALSRPFSMGGRELVLSASIGIVVGGPGVANVEAMLRDAGAAVQQAKTRGKGRHELFDPHAQAPVQDRLAIESALREAVSAAAFEIHYQPIVSLTTRRCVGFESLVRWTHDGRPVSPGDFVPMAEELGIIGQLGTWMLQQATRAFADWKRRYPNAGLEFITVNVSARQLVEQGFAYLVEQAVEQHGLKPSDLRLEITETALMDAPQAAAQLLAELRAYGVRIYLDDFGTGYSSLSHLHKLPVDALKIDRSFVRGLLTPDRPAIVESILALARTLNTSVVAEGIEDERQAIELERLGCRHAQGYYFSKPIPAEAVEELLASDRTLGAMRVPSQPPRAALLKAV